MAQQKIIIYSVNTNNYDDFIMDNSIASIYTQNIDLKYYLFTDKKIINNHYSFLEQILIKKGIESNSYDIIYKSFIKKIKIPNGITIDRYIKFNPIKFLPKHDISIYHDARIIIFPQIFNEINKFKYDFDWLSIRHRYRKSFKSELLICFAYMKINIIDFIKIKKFSKKLGFNSKKKEYFKLAENGLLIRKSNKKVLKASKTWTSISKLTIRDQLSLPITFFYLRGINIKRKFLKENFIDSNFAKVRVRKNNYSSLINSYIKFICSIRFIIIFTLDLLLF